MNTPSIEEKRKTRFRLLHKLYELTNGVADSHSIDIRAVGKEIGLDAQVALDTFQYLKDEGLTKWMAIGGFGTISHRGVKEVEGALDHRPTTHFPANILVVSQSPGAQVVQGQNITATQSQTTSTANLIKELEYHLTNGVENVPESVRTLLDEAKKEPVDKLALAGAAKEVSCISDTWKKRMSGFVQEFAANFSSSAVIEALKFGISSSG